jgi:hypothetical protein
MPGTCAGTTIQQSGVATTIDVFIYILLAVPTT